MPRVTRVHGFAIALIFASAACGVGGDGFGAGGSAEGGFAFGGDSAGGSSYDGGTGGAGAQPPGAFDYAKLCGISRCVPGELVDSCELEDGGGDGGASNGGGASEGGANSGGASSDGGAAQGGAGQGGAAGDGSCQIADAGGDPEAACGPSGTTIINGVCNSSADCLPGLGCVLVTSAEPNTGGGPMAPSTGICRPYCCGELEDCAEGTFCAPQPMFDAAAALPDPALALPIPVCMPIASCQLLGGDCDADETCSVVRANGATSCVEPGDGTLCQPCECAPGFVCNFGTGLCLQLCDTSKTDCPGTGALCQGGTNFPDQVGVCVGGDSDC